jgi:hypothetical protein
MYWRVDDREGRIYTYIYIYIYIYRHAGWMMYLTVGGKWGGMGMGRVRRG